MSTYEPKDNTGSIFINDRKEKDSHPDRQGSCVIDGKEYWISGWMKRTKEGEPWMSIAFKPKEQARSAQKPAQPARRPPPSRNDDDGVPF